MHKINKTLIIVLMSLFSFYANAGGVIQGSIGVSLTILPSGNSCGVLDDSKVCSNDAQKWDSELKNSKTMITNENCQAYRDGDFIIVSY